MADNIPTVLRKIADYLENAPLQPKEGITTWEEGGYQTGGSVAERAQQVIRKYAGTDDQVGMSFMRHKFDVIEGSWPRRKVWTPADAGYYEKMLEITKGDPLGYFQVDAETMRELLAAILQQGGAALPDWYVKMFPPTTNYPAAGGGKL